MVKVSVVGNLLCQSASELRNFSLAKLPFNCTDHKKTKRKSYFVLDSSKLVNFFFLFLFFLFFVFYFLLLGRGVRS